MLDADRPAQLQIAGARVARAFGRDHAVLTATGAAALELALAPLLKGNGSEVIVPDEICHRVAASVIRVGAAPVFVAVDRSLVLDPEAVAAAVTPHTVAVVVVHQYGLPAPLAALRAALPPVVALIEDVAQAWDVRSAGLPVGNTGVAAVTSFGAGKPVRAGSGGGLLSSSPEHATKVAGHPEERHLAYPPMPAPFPEPLADKLLDALDHVDALIMHRRRAVAELLPALARRGLEVRPLGPDDSSAWHRLPVWAPDTRWRDQLVEACLDVGISAQPPHPVRVHELPMFAGARHEGDLRRAERSRLVLVSTDDANVAELVALALRNL